MKMTDCYYEKKDWRACAKEASILFYNRANKASFTCKLGLKQLLIMLVSVDGGFQRMLEAAR